MKTWTVWVVAAIVALGSASVVAEQTKSPAKNPKPGLNMTAK